ncbi:MAG: BrnT family toxin [Nitrosomonas sp.]|uniref:BrnT family toxin n=1 Tax=Nitrosomonas sp. TaxID=42353 RepID=UPI001D4F61C6|nr:BrnT family toxin [Nitrosomonas sp.]
MIDFEWDTGKAVSNRKKHGVSFEEAQSVFYDDFAVQFFDEDSVSEDRFLMLGMSNEARILIVCYCERNSGNIIRIISLEKQLNRNVNFIVVKCYES